MSRALQQRLLLVVGAVTLAAAMLGTYARDVLTDSSEFADRAAVAFEQPEVRTELTKAIVDEMVEAAPELVAISPLLVSIVDGVLASETASSLLRAAVDDVHRTLFTDDDDTIILTVSGLILVAKAQITALDPQLGALIPDDLTESVIETRERAMSLDVARFVEGLDFWIFLLVAAALAAFIAALWRVPHASDGLVGIGLALIGTAVMMLLAVIVGRWLFIDSSEPAATAIWQAFIGPFDRWILVVGALGAILATIAWYGVDDVDLAERREQIAHLVRRRSTRRGRVMWGLAATVAGIVVLTNAAPILRLGVATVGAFTIVIGLREVALSLFPGLASGVSDRLEEQDEVAGPERRDRLGRAAASVLIVAVAVAGAIAIAGSDGEDAEATSASACNGSEDACDRRLGEVTLAATHNSNAAAEAGFLNGYQTFDMERQLEDGVRGLLIDVYFGFDERGLVITDRAPLTPEERDELVADVGEAAVAAAEATSEEFESSGVQRELFLCHALCEIGATRFVEDLTMIRRFLDEHPREVLVIIIQDEGPLPPDVAGAFEESGLIEYLHVQDLDAPFPTLGEMIESGKRVFVSAENNSGEFDWYHDAFTFVQDTEFKFESVADFDCELNRGEPGSPLLLVNHWVSPVSPTGSEEANQAAVLQDRFADCVEVRGMVPALIAVDFYERGDLLEFVAAVN